MKHQACLKLCIHFPCDLSVVAELLTVWEVEACSSPASCVSMWQESRCSCSSSWEVSASGQRGHLKASPLWLTCWLLMCSCISSSPPSTAGQYAQCTADAVEPGSVKKEHPEPLLGSYNRADCVTLLANITAMATVMDYLKSLST